LRHSENKKIKKMKRKEMEKEKIIRLNHTKRKNKKTISEIKP